MENCCACADSIASLTRAACQISRFCFMSLRPFNLGALPGLNFRTVGNKSVLYCGPIISPFRGTENSAIFNLIIAVTMTGFEAGTLWVENRNLFATPIVERGTRLQSPLV